MRTFNLAPEADDGLRLDHFAELKRDLKRAADQEITVFNLHHCTPSMTYVLSTTSKEMYLRLGILSLTGLYALCLFLEETFEENQDPIVIFEKKEFSKNKYSGLLVTQAKREPNKIIIFHLSPVH